MFELRPDQLTLFSANKLSSNARAKVPVLREKFPRVFQFYSDKQVFEWVQRQFNTFQTLGVDSQYAEETLLDLFALYGENFERCEDRRWAETILSSSTLDGDQKATLLLHESGLLTGNTPKD